jgi:hypothetical protein
VDRADGGAADPAGGATDGADGRDAGPAADPADGAPGGGAASPPDALGDAAPDENAEGVPGAAGPGEPAAGDAVNGAAAVAGGEARAGEEAGAGGCTEIAGNGEGVPVGLKGGEALSLTLLGTASSQPGGLVPRQGTAPSSRGLGRRPLKAVTPVRIRSGLHRAVFAAFAAACGAGILVGTAMTGPAYLSARPSTSRTYQSAWL